MECPKCKSNNVCEHKMNFCEYCFEDEDCESCSADNALIHVYCDDCLFEWTEVADEDGNIIESNDDGAKPKAGLIEKFFDI